MAYTPALKKKKNHSKGLHGNRLECLANQGHKPLLTPGEMANISKSWPPIQIPLTKMASHSCVRTMMLMLYNDHLQKML